MFPEITARCRFRSVESPTEINPVQIQLYDLLFAEAVFDSLGQKNLEQLAAERSFLERETIARQLLCDRARALTHPRGDEVLEGCANDAEEIVAVMAIKFCVFNGDDGVNQIRRQLVVGDRLAVLDINLAEDLALTIENYAGRFHLLELAQIEHGGARFELCRDDREINRRGGNNDQRDGDGNVKLRLGVPRTPRPRIVPRTQILRLGFKLSISSQRGAI